MSDKKVEIVEEQIRDLYATDPKFYCDYFKHNMQRGYSFEQVCDSLNITTRTARNWINRHSEFELAIMEGRLPQVEVAENKLLQLVNGFSYVEKKKEKITFSNGESSFKITETTRHIPPNAVAIKFLLVNLARNKWLSESRIEAQQDLLSMLQNASEKELLEVKQALLKAKESKSKQIDEGETNGN